MIPFLFARRVMNLPLTFAFRNPPVTAFASRTTLRLEHFHWLCCFVLLHVLTAVQCSLGAENARLQ